MHRTPGVVAAHVGAGGNAERRDDVDADARHHIAQRVMGAEPGAAAGEVVADALAQPAARSRCAANSPPSEPPMISARRRGMRVLELAAQFAVERAGAAAANEEIERHQADQDRIFGAAGGPEEPLGRGEPRWRSA